MVITVEGYNYLNGATYVASTLGAFSAMSAGENTLIVDLIDRDFDTPERLLYNVTEDDGLISAREARLADEGIDQLLRIADTQKLMRGDFNQYILPVLQIENRLDIATITKTDNFTKSLAEPIRLDALTRLLESAKEIYSNIVLLLPTRNQSLSNKIRNLTYEVKNPEDNTVKSVPCVDASVFCIKQGTRKDHEPEVQNVNKVMYLVTDYDAGSIFNLTDIANTFVGRAINLKNAMSNKKTFCFKVEENTGAKDAIISGNLAKFVARNRLLKDGADNYTWVKDWIATLNTLTNGHSEEDATDWEAAEFVETKQRLTIARNKHRDEERMLRREAQRLEAEAKAEFNEEDFKPAAEVKKLSRKELREKRKAEEAEAKRRAIEEENRRKEEARLAEEERKRQEEEAERLRKEEEERKRKILEEKRKKKEALRKQQEELLAKMKALESAEDELDEEDIEETGAEDSTDSKSEKDN